MRQSTHGLAYGMPLSASHATGRDPGAWCDTDGSSCKCYVVGTSSGADTAQADVRLPHLCKAKAGGHAKKESALCTGC